MRRLFKNNNNMIGSLPAKSRDGGFALVNIIVAILIFSILGAALVKILSSSTFSQVGSNSSMRAYYLAEGGYRYAGSKFLHAGITEIARDDMLLTLNNTTYTMANNAGSFSLQSYPWFYKSSFTGSTTTSLITKVNGAISPNLAIPVPGKISVSGAVYSYNGIAISGSTVTFSGISPALPAVPADKTTVLPVGVSTVAAQTFANGGNLNLASGASSFPPYHGTFRIAGNNTVYAYRSRSGNILTNITDFSNPGAAFSVNVSASTNVTLLKYLELHSTGTVGSGAMAANRMVNYRGPISSVSTDQSGGETNVIPPDSFNGPGNPNWLPNSDPLVHGRADIDSAPPGGGGSALEVTGKSSSDHFVLPASSQISDALKGIWSWSNGLSYDAQVKILISSNISFASGGIYFRRHPSGSVNTSFGLSILYLKDYNDPSTDVFVDKINNQNSADNDTNSCYRKRNANPNTPYCLFPDKKPYLVLWKDTAGGPSGFRTIAFYELPATMNPVPDWTTLMVRIKETPSAPSYCGSLSGQRVNQIQIYYSTNVPGSGNNNPKDDPLIVGGMRLGNLRGSVNWPPDTGGTTAQNDFFTLVGWTTHDALPAGIGPGFTSSYQFGNPGDGANTVVCTTENLTNIGAYGNSGGPASPFPPEVALAALGNNIQNHVWFDDFAIGSGPGGGVTTIGFLPPIQQ